MNTLRRTKGEGTKPGDQAVHGASTCAELELIIQHSHHFELHMFHFELWWGIKRSVQTCSEYALMLPSK